MDKFHIALSVKNLAESIADYKQRLAAEPVVVVDNEYALWRTAILNFSIRQTADGQQGFRHIGFESEQAEVFAESTDINGIVWESFSREQQLDEIKSLWPNAEVKS